MLIHAIRLALTLYFGRPDGDYVHEQAHVICEESLYRAIAPATKRGATDPRVEPLAETLCRNDEI